MLQNSGDGAVSEKLRRVGGEEVYLGRELGRLEKLPIDTRDILTRFLIRSGKKRVRVQMEGVGGAAQHVPNYRWSYSEIILFDRVSIRRQRIRFPKHSGFTEPEMVRPLQGLLDSSCGAIEVTGD